MNTKKVLYCLNSSVYRSHNGYRRSPDPCSYILILSNAVYTAGLENCMINYEEMTTNIGTERISLTTASRFSLSFRILHNSTAIKLPILVLFFISAMSELVLS